MFATFRSLIKKVIVLLVIGCLLFNSCSLKKNPAVSMTHRGVIGVNDGASDPAVNAKKNEAEENEDGKVGDSDGNKDVTPLKKRTMTQNLANWFLSFFGEEIKNSKEGWKRFASVTFSNAISPASIVFIMGTVGMGVVYSSPGIAVGLGLLAFTIPTIWTMQRNPEATASELNLKVAGGSNLFFGGLAGVELLAVVGGIFYNKTQFEQMTCRLQQQAVATVKGYKKKAAKQVQQTIKDLEKKIINQRKNSVATTNANEDEELRHSKMMTVINNDRNAIAAMNKDREAIEAMAAANNMTERDLALGMFNTTWGTYDVALRELDRPSGMIWITCMLQDEMIQHVKIRADARLQKARDDFPSVNAKLHAWNMAKERNDHVKALADMKIRHTKEKAKEIILKQGMDSYEVLRRDGVKLVTAEKHMDEMQLRKEIIIAMARIQTKAKAEEMVRYAKEKAKEIKRRAAVMANEIIRYAQVDEKEAKAENVVKEAKKEAKNVVEEAKKKAKEAKKETEKSVRGIRKKVKENRKEGKADLGEEAKVEAEVEVESEEEDIEKYHDQYERFFKNLNK